ncbi:MAG: glyoxylate/hydroxypyruvate reductase A [Bacteroidetes bacterium]|nr:MAG: glyoxylate/hydroxypyruvate reductase A [Bacteroidota bacterium]
MSLVIFSNVHKIQPWIDALKDAGPDVEVISYEQIQDREKVQFALAWNHPKGIFKNYPNLKCISSMGAGVDHIMNDPDIPGQTKIVRIIDPLLSQDLAEFALSLIMSHMRGLGKYFHLQNKKVWKKSMYKRIADLKVGIMGTGAIGNHVALFLQSCGFSVAGWGKNPGKHTEYRRFHGYDQLDEFLCNINILICLLPLTPETEGILDKHTLQKLPQGAYVINLGRGLHIIDQDLIEMIDKGHLAGAGLDVFEHEPLPAEHPFWSHPGIQITPHVASLTTPASVAPQIIENYRRAVNDQDLLNLVNRDQGY